MRKNAIKVHIFSAILVVFLVLLDQYSKYIAVEALAENGTIPLIEGALEFMYVQNTGAAFSFLTGHTWVFLVVTPILMAIICYAYFKIPTIKKFAIVKLLLVFIFAGAIGNFIDRITLGYVRDFIYISLINFPIFNIADIYVTVSLILLIILFIFKYKDSELSNIFESKRDKNNG